MSSGKGTTTGSSHRSSGDETFPGGFNDLRHSINEGLRILYLRRWIFFVPFCIVASAGFIASHYIPRSYKASIIFERRSDPIIASLLSANFTSSSFETMRRTLRFDLCGTDALRNAVEDLKLYEHIPRQADGTLSKEAERLYKAKASELAGCVTMRWWERSPNLDMIEINYLGKESSISRSLLTALMNKYANTTREKIADILTRALRFFEKEAEQRQALLDDVEKDTLQFKIDYPGVNPNDPDAIHFKLVALEARREQLQDSLREFTADLGSQQGFLREQLTRTGNTADVITPDKQDAVLKLPQLRLSQSALRLKSAIRQVVDDINNLKTERGMTENHPEVVALREYKERLDVELAVAIAQPCDDELLPKPVTLNDSPSRGRDSAFILARAQSEAEIRKLQQLKTQSERTLHDINEEIDYYRNVKSTLFVRRQEYEQMSAETDRLRQNLTFWQSNIEQVERSLLAEDSERGVKFAVVEGPTGGYRPYTPRSITILMLCLVAGAAAGTASVLLTELFDRRFRTAAHVSRSLSLPVLECIDLIVSPVEHRRQFLRRAFFVPPLTMCLLALVLYTGSLAYFSIERPEIYERLCEVPRSVIGYFTEGDKSPSNTG